MLVDTTYLDNAVAAHFGAAERLWYELGAARRELGYEPVVSMDQGLIRLYEHLLGEGR